MSNIPTKTLKARARLLCFDEIPLPPELHHFVLIPSTTRRIAIIAAEQLAATLMKNAVDSLKPFSA